MDRSRHLLVIPCWNEAATIAKVVARARSMGEVLVIDDRSTDGSAAAAAKAGAEVLTSETKGYDGAVTTGLREAARRGAHAITLDADGEHDPEAAATFLQALGAGADAVCGVRGFRNRWVERALEAPARKSLGVSDPFCGMKGYSAGLLGIFVKSGLPLHVNLTPLALAKALGRPVAEAAVGGAPRADASRFSGRLRGELTLLAAYRAALRAARTFAREAVP